MFSMNGFIYRSLKTKTAMMMPPAEAAAAVTAGAAAVVVPDRPLPVAVILKAGRAEAAASLVCHLPTIKEELGRILKRCVWIIYFLKIQHFFMFLHNDYNFSVYRIVWVRITLLMV